MLRKIETRKKKEGGQSGQDYEREMIEGTKQVGAGKTCEHFHFLEEQRKVGSWIIR